MLIIPFCFSYFVCLTINCGDRIRICNFQLMRLTSCHCYSAIFPIKCFLILSAKSELSPSRHATHGRPTPLWLSANTGGITHLAGLEPVTLCFVGIRSIQIELQMYSGQDWIRTNVDRSRRIYSPLQLPLCDLSLLCTFFALPYVKQLNIRASVV